MLIPAVRQQVFALLDSVQPKSRYKVLILDDRAKELIDLVCDRAELLNRQVANVLKIDEPRPTEEYLEAVYIVEQTHFTLDCISADYQKVPRRYAAGHVFLLKTLRATETELHSFMNSSIARHLKTVQAASIDIYALEQRLYTLGLAKANTMLYNVACKDNVLEFVDQSGRQLAMLAKALGVKPYVRHSERWTGMKTQGFTKLIAKAASEHIAAESAKYMTPERENDARPTLLVVDRSTDLTAPLRHEFGFQSMCLDVLPMTPALTLNHFESADTDGLLSDSDNTWVDLRHKHLVAVTEELKERIQELKQTNPHFADPTTEVSVNDVRNMLASLPEFMKERDSVTLSLDMAMECMDAIEKQGLKEITDLEQTLVLGTNQEHVKPLESQLAEALVVLLGNRHTPHAIKLRALALYAVHRKGIQEADLDRLKHHAKLEDKDIDAIKALEYLGWPIVYRGRSAEKYPAALTAERSDQKLLFCRVKPGLQTVCEQLIAGKMDVREYPFDGDVPSHEQEAISTATSLRNPRQRATWAQNVAAAPVSPTSSMDGGARTSSDILGKKPRKLLIVFVVGGITAAEAAVAYELSDTTAYNVVVGGHDLLTPQKYLDFLCSMRTPREQLALPMDAPRRQTAAPEYLRASDRENRKVAEKQARTAVGTAASHSTAAGAAPSRPTATATATSRPTATYATASHSATGYAPGSTVSVSSPPSNTSSAARTRRPQTPTYTNAPAARQSPTTASYGEGFSAVRYDANINATLNSQSLQAPAKEDKKKIKHILKGFKKKL